MKKTIVILSHVTSSNSPYCDYVHSHAMALKKEGYKVIVFACVNYFPLLSLFKKNKRFLFNMYKGTKEIDGIKVIYKKKLSFSKFFYNSRFNLNGFFYYLAIKKIFKRIMKNHDVVLIDAHTFKVEGYAAYRLKKKYRIKTFITCHGSSFNDSFKTENGRRQIKKISKVIDSYVCVSDKIKKQLETLDITNAVVIYNGINLFKRKKLKKENNIITVGSLTPNKNIDVVIAAYKIVKEKFPEVKLTIIGTGSDLDKLKIMAADDSHISFLGHIPNSKVHDNLEKNLIFILPSSPEGFGIVYAEAMYNKCITIGTKGEGIDGFIRNGENGFLVSIDYLEIAKIVCEILDNPSKYNNLQMKAFLDAKKLTWQNNAKKYIELLGG